MSPLAADDLVLRWDEPVAGARAPLVVLEPLIALLRERGIAAGAPGVEAIGDGLSNATFRLTFEDGPDLVLRRPPRGPLPPSAHDVLREARVMTALGASSVPVPRVVTICDDTTVIGAPFYLMEHVHGHVPSHGLPETLERAGERRRVGEALADTLAAIHALDLKATGLDGLGRPGGYLERQLRRHLALWEHNRTRDLPDVARVAAWLEQHLPQAGSVTFVHGDFHPGNVMLAHDAPARVVAVLDWELATQGDPLADLGYLAALWREPGDPPHPLERGPVTRGEGSLTRAELVRRYAETSGRSVAGHEWYEVLALWRAIIFMEGNYRRGLQGAADTPFLIGYGDQVPLLAEFAVARIAAFETSRAMGRAP